MRFSVDEMAASIRAARARADISQSELAQRVGLNVWTINKYESGEMMPGADKIAAMADALGCTPNDIIGWDRQ